MFKIIFTICLARTVLSQGGYHSNPQTAAIISEQRYLSGDGKFGAAYAQEDGINFKEETDSDGTRHGSYSYVDPTGQRRTISYTAGKNGFQATGDHLPVAPAAPPQVAPQAQYQPQQQYQENDRSYEDNGQYDSRYNSPNYSAQKPQFPAAPRSAPVYDNPQTFYNQHQPVHYSHNFQHQSQPSQFNHNQHQSQPAHLEQNFQNHQASYNPIQTTPNPHRFQPSGKLSLNRTPDGFSYSFSKVK